MRGCHDANLSHSYCWAHAYLKKNAITVFAEYIRRFFLYLGMYAKIKRQKKKSNRMVQNPYPYLVFSA